MGFCSLRVVTQPAQEPVSLSDARAHLRLDSEDSQVLAYLAAARGWVELYLNRALITQTLRYTLSPSQPPGIGSGMPINPIILVAPLTWWPASGMPIDLPLSPVQAITEVSQRSRDGVVRTLDPARDYFGDASNEPGRVTLRGISQPPGSDLSITYSAGYGDAPAAVPMAIQQAIKLLLGFFYEHRGDDDCGEAPAAVKMLLYPYRLVTFA